MTVSDHVTLCVVCTNILPNNRKKFCSTRCKSKFNYQSYYHSQQQRASKRKSHFVEKAGGCCTKCGYDKCASALSFHHRDPSSKKFPLDARHLSNRSMAKLEIEFAKCDLLCLNCHAEEHHLDYNTIKFAALTD